MDLLIVALESLFLGVPNLTILSPSIFHDPGIVLTKAVEKIANPTLFIENKCVSPENY